MELAFLNPLFDRPGPWASVYVDTSRHSESTPDERSLDALSAFRNLTAQGADEPTCQTVYSALEELRHSPQPVGRALFATGGEVVLDPPLSRPPDASPLVHWGTLPHVAPLLRLADPAPVCLVAYVDRRGADFEVRGAHGARPAGGVAGRQWPVHKASTADWSERHFQAKVENTWEHNAAEIAGALVACAEETRADLIVLVGGARERRAVHDRLLPQLQTRTIESEHGGRADGADAGGRLLDDEVAGARAEHARREVEREVAAFLAGREQAEGRAAAEGVPALVEAAREHRIAELLLAPGGADARRSVWVGREPDQVAVRRADARVLGADAPGEARADDALLRAAAASGAGALAVEDASGVPEGGLGALLRWA